MSEFYQQYFCPYDEKYSLIIEDNGQVAYAYLLSGENIISDVWLYNQQETPSNIKWTDRDSMPFLNPKEYILANTLMNPILSDLDVNLDWTYEDILVEVKIYIRKETIAILRPGLCPGISLLACKNGPLARKYNNI